MAEELISIHVRESSRSRQQSQELLRGQMANEFVFAVVGHVGSGTSTVADQLRQILTTFQLRGTPFEVEILKARKQIESWAQRRERALGVVSEKSITVAKRLQDWGDDMRAEEDHAAVARRLLNEIRLCRARKQGTEIGGATAVLPDGKPRAYILDAIRHPAEVHLLRSVYQNAFTLIGVVCDEQVREGRITHKFEDARSEYAREFMKRDAQDPDPEKKHGQRVSDAFHLADVFLDNTQDRKIGKPAKENPDWDIPEQLARLVKIVTHDEIIRPTMAETAMYEAYGAQMRSACLSRQVGAALVDQYGNLIATGTNEVPRAGGGVYGELFADVGGSDGKAERPHDHRCAYREGSEDRRCQNTHEQNQIINDLIDDLIGGESPLISPKRTDELRSALRRTRIRGLLEFSRAVHAEMDALLTAARKGVPTTGARMFVTTFPCHYCARHLVSAGVDEVQYIEPYPKSLAFKLHPDSITKDAVKDWTPPSRNGARVLFRPFTGVAPRMYRRAFLKDRPLKKDATGELAIGDPEWGSPWDLGRLSYVQLEAEFSRGLDRAESEE